MAPNRSHFRVYFACVGNSARSILAEAFAKLHGGPFVAVASGGSRPHGEVLPETLKVLGERGVSVVGLRSKGLDNDFAREADVIVTMGCGDDACPAFIGKPIEDWDLPDPKGKSLDDFRSVRDEVERRVIDLFKRRGVPLARASPA